MRAICLSLLLLPAAGCIPVTDFNPVGDYAAIAGSWLIDGAAPTDESCRALVRPFVSAGTEPPLPRVRVSFIDGRRSVPHSGLIFNCVETCGPDNPTCMSGAFDTGERRVVGFGAWRIRLEVIDAAGRVVAVSETQGLFDSLMRIDLAPAEFFSGIISAATAIDGVAPTQTSCDDHGIAAARFGGDVTACFGAGVEPCPAGGVGLRCPPGTYTLHLETVAGATVLTTFPTETITLTSGQQYFLNGGDPIELSGP